MLRRYNFIIMPVLNPDGYVYTWKTDKTWRKNRSPPRKTLEGAEGCVGVDINRNFAVNHCENKTRNYCSKTNCGPTVFSEKETRAIRKVIFQQRGCLLAYFSLHSYGPVWLYPHAFSYSNPPNQREMARVAEIGAKALKEVRGTEMKVGMASKISYIAPGTSLDFAFLKGKAKYSYIIEIGSKTYISSDSKKILPLLQETYEGICAAVLALRR